MPRNASPIPYKRRQEPVVDEYIEASIQRSGGVHNSDGHYATLIYAGCSTRERAEEIKKALYRCAAWMARNNVHDVSMHAVVKKNGDEFDVIYKAVNKAHARAYMVTKYGSDMSKWPYSPRKGFSNYNA